jgi:glucokinase
MARPWYLLADIGGTNARFAAAEPESRLPALQRVFPVAGHDSFASALDAFMGELRREGDWSSSPAGACIAVAAPVGSGTIRMTNASWSIDRRACAAQLQLEAVEVINDFVAQGYAVPALLGADLRTLHAGEPAPGAACLVLGPGTGLGVCIGVPTADGWIVLPGEGGHVDLPVTTEEEWSLLRHLAGRYEHVSAERVLSGPGLQAIYSWLEAREHGVPGEADSPVSAATIGEAALAGTDSRARRSVELFLGLLAAVAGDAALTAGARGGVYLAGGILPRLWPLLARGDFRERFIAKGRYRAYLAAMPLHLIVHPQPGLLGALQYLRARQGG